MFSVLANAAAPAAPTAPAAPAAAAVDIKKDAVEKIASESTLGLCQKNMLAACFTYSEADCKAKATAASIDCVNRLGAKQPASFTDKAAAKAYTKELSNCARGELVKGGVKEECPLSK